MARATVRQLLGGYQFLALNFAPFVGPAFVLSEQEANALLDKGGNVARWYDLPEALNEKVQDHVALAFALWPVAQTHAFQFVMWKAEQAAKIEEAQRRAAAQSSQGVAQQPADAAPEYAAFADSNYEAAD